MVGSLVADGERPLGDDAQHVALVAADVVLADGQFVRASSDENPDLFWALRGGGGNFGVVTAFTFRLHPVSTLYAGPMFYDIDDAADVLEAEATEDIEKLGGSVPLDKPYLHTSIFELMWKRVRWLLVLFVAEAYTGTVLRHYEDTLSAAVSERILCAHS